MGDVGPTYMLYMHLSIFVIYLLPILTLALLTGLNIKNTSKWI